ncbi:Retrovirus-related Pol polyprotein from transposon TNT 1-94 [Bienertia sinuspersici]
MGSGTDDEDEKGYGYAGMVCCNRATMVSSEWIVDRGASDHMTCGLRQLNDPKPADGYPTIILPNGKTANITHVGAMVWDTECKVNFLADMCVIQDKNNEIRGVRKVNDGLYYLINRSISEIVGQLKNQKKVVRVNLGSIKQDQEKLSTAMLWHARLGHTHMNNVKLLGVMDSNQDCNEELKHQCIEDDPEDENENQEVLRQKEVNLEEEGVSSLQSIEEDDDTPHEQDEETLYDAEPVRRSTRTHREPSWMKNYAVTRSRRSQETGENLLRLLM